MKSIVRAGKFRAQAVSHEWQRSRDKGTEYVSVAFCLLEGPDEGSYVYWNGFFTENSEQRTVDSLLLAGWDGSSIGMLPGLGTKEVQVVVEHETYKDKTKAKVAWVNSPSAGGLAEDTLASLGGRLAGMVQHRKQALSRELESAPELDQPESQFDSPPPGDDDVPF